MADTADEVEASSAEDEEATDAALSDGEAPSVIELLVQLGRDVSVLVFLETQLAGELQRIRRGVGIHRKPPCRPSQATGSSRAVDFRLEDDRH